MVLLLVAACNNKPDEGVQPNSTALEDLSIPEDFNFETENINSITIDTDLKNTPFRLMNEHLAVILEEKTDANGQFSHALNIPTASDKIYLQFNKIGVPQDSFAISRSAGFDFQLKTSRGNERSQATKINGDPGLGFTYLGGWDTNGVPDYLEPISDNISGDFIQTIQTTLPQGYPVPEYNPHYLQSSVKEFAVTQNNSEVWITFVHESAGFKNTIGFYTYPTNTPPQTPEELSHKTIIFPNASLNGSGGGLMMGDKVKLGTFDAGTSIGFFIIPSGYDGQQPSRSPLGTFYSLLDLNPEQDPNQQHMVMLWDQDEDRFVLGFEDLNRENSGCDHDFNDLVLTITSTPQFSTSNVPTTQTFSDSDNDGVDNAFDRDPNDARRTYYDYYPGAGTYASLTFEDLWPSKGDYDFNDLVLDYQYQIVKNADYKVSFIEGIIIIKAIGAGYSNGFAISFPELGQGDIESTKIVTKDPNDAVFSTGLFQRASDGTERGQRHAVIPIFENAYDIMPSFGGAYVNVVKANPYLTPDTLRFSIELTTPKLISEIGNAPFDPFMIANMKRGYEIHLPGHENTSLADVDLFGEGDDDSNLSGSKLYKSNHNLPWAINLPVSFDYTQEGKSIEKGHLKFVEWVQSGGSSYQDWYLDLPEYRNDSNIY
ncbi:LruC domain-containing protein [Persicobacter psychrovividus]|uniref:LruC domain-containing protein n=2 Tax=Persicobacter psychrovividus TaxID=387638 RepID=A0ABM7VAK6_9BACT|nr:LruC domain-containing protein [Persicobacter psychrovividus]